MNRHCLIWKKLRFLIQLLLQRRFYRNLFVKFYNCLVTCFFHCIFYNNNLSVDFMTQFSQSLSNLDISTEPKIVPVELTFVAIVKETPSILQLLLQRLSWFSQFLKRAASALQPALSLQKEKQWQLFRSGSENYDRNPISRLRYHSCNPSFTSSFNIISILFLLLISSCQLHKATMPSDGLSSQPARYDVGTSKVPVIRHDDFPCSFRSTTSKFRIL